MTEETTGLFWERLEGEPETAFNAFAFYRDMGITRSLAKAAAAFYSLEHEGHRTDPEGAPNPAALRRLKEWSRTWMWVARVEAFDADEARERSLRMRERRIKTAEYHWTVGQLAMQRIAERLQHMQFDEYVPLKSLATLMNAAGNLQRLALGESNAVVDLRGSAVPREDEDTGWLDALSVEDKEELVRVMGLMPEEDPLPGDSEEEQGF